MRNPLLLALLASLSLAGSARAATIVGIGSTQFVRPGTVFTADATRRGDPIVFFDRVSSDASSDELLHVSVYANGLVTVARASFASTSTEAADFSFLGAEAIGELRQALISAGAPRLNGLLPGSGLLPPSTERTTVTFFLQNRTLRARPFTANSFSFGPDVLDPRAARIEDLIEDFVDDNFPDL